MTRDRLKKVYFEWIYRLVCDERYTGDLSYRKLLTRLNEIDFVYIIDEDGNREEDGIDLRYRFGYENSIEQPIIATYLDDRPCSVLEMMAALAFRCEEHIMYDPDIGNRTGRWFWEMITSLGLCSMNDDVYDELYVDRVVERFLERKYKRNGDGGLFKVKDRSVDMREIEIWYQMCRRLNEIT